MRGEVNESDWKLFRKKIGGWQEAYMEKLCGEYMALLAKEGKGSDKFWKLEKRIRKDKKSTGVVAEMSRSCMVTNLVNLYLEGAITKEDLSDFSIELQNQVLGTVEFFSS